MRSKNTDLMNEIKKFAEEYYLEYWKSPSTSEIAGAVGVTEYSGRIEHPGRFELNTFVAYD